MGDPGHGEEGFHEPARGGGFGGLAALLQHHVALAVELPEHGVLQAVGLQPGPELQFVGGHGDVVEGPVVAGVGVQPRGAGLLVDLVQLILHDEAALLLHQGVEFGEELLVPLGTDLGIVHVGDLAPTLLLPQDVDLFPDLGLDLVLEVVQLRIPLGIARADGRGPLEHHVFEEVGQARDAGAFVGASHPGHPAAGDGGLIVPFHHQEAHAVGKGVFLDGNGLGQQRRRDNQRGDEASSRRVDHGASKGWGVVKDQGWSRPGRRSDRASRGYLKTGGMPFVKTC
ncbi:MAG: hypothetical protein BWY56_02534 [Acidobacteria bacterium ADurb.Bin340]|nr:MAG: hypothetical protein BWY56_02534 [Acidobacteria bacterium ADurb.Bin340]